MILIVKAIWPMVCRGLVMPWATVWLDAPYQIVVLSSDMVVIVSGYALCVTSQYEFIFTFANTVLAKFVDTTCIFRDAGAAVGQGEQ